MTSSETRKKLAALIEAKSFTRGSRVLASGRQSAFYFDMKPTMFDAEGASLLAQLVVERLIGARVDRVGGLEMGAVPLVAAVVVESRRAGRPLNGFFVRKAVKEHGTRKLVEGAGDLAGKSVAILEDVTTTGQSAMKAVGAAREAGAEIALVLTILDRQEGASELFAAAGIPFQSLFTADEFLRE